VDGTQVAVLSRERDARLVRVVRRGCRSGRGPVHTSNYGKPSGGDMRDLTRTVEIHAAHYRTGSLTVAPKLSSPDPRRSSRSRLSRN